MKRAPVLQERKGGNLSPDCHLIIIIIVITKLHYISTRLLGTTSSYPAEFCILKNRPCYIIITQYLRNVNLYVCYVCAYWVLF
jgi:hypothetical protein